jgi:hypothetical protein
VPLEFYSFGVTGQLFFFDKFKKNHQALFFGCDGAAVLVVLCVFFCLRVFVVVVWFVCARLTSSSIY